MSLLPISLGLWYAPAATAGASSAAQLAKAASYEFDPEIALEMWDQVVAIDGGTSMSLYKRGCAHLLVGDLQLAIEDLGRAQQLLQGERSGAIAYLPSGATVPQEVVTEALAFDGMGLAKGRLGDWAGAVDSFERALGTVGLAGASEASVPTETPYSGLRGGAASLGQRLELNAAMARFGGGDVKGAVAALQRVDKGPNPDGYPQFWDARAALAVSLFASGARGAAEMEWADLCRPAPPPPPSVPTNPFYARVNQTAQAFLSGQGRILDLTSNNCEDYESGLFLPCDDAGIPGLGGSSSPCALYTAPEARSRLWPDSMVAELNSQAK
eukprot:gene15996-22130_t